LTSRLDALRDLAYSAARAEAINSGLIAEVQEDGSGSSGHGPDGADHRSRDTAGDGEITIIT